MISRKNHNVPNFIIVVMLILGNEWNYIITIINEGLKTVGYKKMKYLARYSVKTN